MQTGPASPRGGAAWVRGCLVLIGLGVAFVAVVTWSARPTGARGGGGARVGVIRVEGGIESSRGFREELRRLEEDARVRALVVRIDSPGGGVAATQEMADELRRYQTRTGHPVVASLGGLAASGGYYLACAAREIVCEPGTLTGSIGVLLSFVDASELLRKLGVRIEVVKSGERKDFGGYWRALTAEERSMLEGVVADAHEQFTSAVAESRGLDPETVRTLADGRILTGRQALAAGLVDTLGFEADAVEMAARLAGLPPGATTLSRERRTPGWLDLLRRMAEDARTPGFRGPRLEYR